MSWHIKKDSLYSTHAREIGYFLPTATAMERVMIKNGDELIDLVGDFMIGKDEGKTFSKKTYDQLRKIIDLDANYNFSWR